MINNMDDFIKYLDTLSNEELREEMESFGIEFKENDELYDNYWNTNYEMYNLEVSFDENVEKYSKSEDLDKAA
jgi:RNA recognition motif-containing protein